MTAKKRKLAVPPFTPHRVTLDEIKTWRQRQHNAGKPSSLDDFFRINRICRECRGSGKEASIAFGGAPVLVACPFCNGTGRS